MKRTAPLKRNAFKRRPPRETMHHAPERSEERSPGVNIDLVHFGRYGANAVHAPQPKSEPVRDECYRRWVASMPCIRCGLVGQSQAAHPNQGRGLSQKADDTDCFPLCCTRPGILGCHAEHDQLVGMTLEERRQRERDYIARVHLLIGRN